MMLSYNDSFVKNQGPTLPEHSTEDLEIVAARLVDRCILAPARRKNRKVEQYLADHGSDHVGTRRVKLDEYRCPCLADENGRQLVGKEADAFYLDANAWVDMTLPESEMRTEDRFDDELTMSIENDPFLTRIDEEPWDAKMTGENFWYSQGKMAAAAKPAHYRRDISKAKAHPLACVEGGIKDKRGHTFKTPLVAIVSAYFDDERILKSLSRSGSAQWVLGYIQACRRKAKKLPLRKIMEAVARQVIENRKVLKALEAARWSGVEFSCWVPDELKENPLVKRVARDWVDCLWKAHGERANELLDQASRGELDALGRSLCLPKEIQEEILRSL